MGFGSRPRLRHETDTARLCINEFLKISSDDVISWPTRKRRSYRFISTPKIQVLRFRSSQCHANLSRDLSILSFWDLVHFNLKFGLFFLNMLEMLAVIVIASTAILCIPYFVLPLFFICFLYFPTDSVLLPAGLFHTYLWNGMSKAIESYTNINPT